MMYGIGCQWNWPLKHSGALERVVPFLGFFSRGVEGGWSGRSGVTLRFRSIQQKYMYEIKKPIGSM